MHCSWDGELLRPYLVAALRGLASPVRWFSARTWACDDRAAVENIIGKDRLVVDPAAASSAELEPRPDAVPLFVENLTDDPGLVDEAGRALRDGSHLLDG